MQLDGKQDSFWKKFDNCHDLMIGFSCHVFLTAKRSISFTFLDFAFTFGCYFACVDIDGIELWPRNCKYTNQVNSSPM